MAIVVNTNSYVTEAELTEYATARGVTISGDTAVLLIKAMDYIEVNQYIGVKTVPSQALQFPRLICGGYGYQDNYYPRNFSYNNGSWFYNGCEYDSTTVPDDIKKAQIVAALLIDSGEDLQATTTQAIKREKVSSLEVEYQDNSTATKSYPQLNALLRPFLLATGVRGVRV